MKSGWKVGVRLGAGVVGLAILTAGTAVLAPRLRADDAAAPARAVRLSSVDGRVQISQGNQMLADPAVANTPLFEGTQIVTMDDGRAEIQFEDGSVARLSPNSAMTLSVLRPDDGSGGTQISVDGGLGYFELQGAGQNTIRVRYGESVVTASGFTVLRIDLDSPPGELAIFSGNAHLERGSALSLDLHGGESVTFSASSPSQYNLAETIEPDSWDTWNSDRDQVLTSESASRTAATSGLPNSANPAWSDLDANGNWYDVPGQGYVWSPYDAANAGWDPYGNGYWMWTPRFGYMWVSGDSWGYMPFNCGMWSFYSGFGWGWAPGMGGCSPWWGGGFYAINVGYGPIGWIPPIRPRPHRGVPPARGGAKNQPYPLVAVNKRPPSGSNGVQPRDRSVSATIAGHVVMPLRPLSPRPQYDHSASAYGNRTALPAAGVRAPSGPAAHAYGPGAPGSHPGTTVGAKPASHPATSHASAPPPASHPSGGGGGGGGGHPSGGGGGAHH
jgi:hypothetical protein